MHYFHYIGGKLYCEGVPVESLVKKFGTPLYVYSQRTLAENFAKLDRALAPLDTASERDHGGRSGDARGWRLAS